MLQSVIPLHEVKGLLLVGKKNCRKVLFRHTTGSQMGRASCHMGDRTPDQCRARYNNSLKPDGKKGQWSDVEDEHIIRLHAEFGNQWSKISSGG